jgi:hypothetical protein
MASRWICAVAICTALSSQAIAEEQPKPRFLARASCTVVRYYVANTQLQPPSRGHAAKARRKPSLRQLDIASKCRQPRGRHKEFSRRALTPRPQRAHAPPTKPVLPHVSRNEEGLRRAGLDHRSRVLVRGEAIGQERPLPKLCRFLDAGNKEAPHAQLTGVQKAPRHEVAGG